MGNNLWMQQKLSSGQNSKLHHGAGDTHWEDLFLTKIPNIFKNCNRGKKAKLYMKNHEETWNFGPRMNMIYCRLLQKSMRFKKDPHIRPHQAIFLCRDITTHNYDWLTKIK